MRFSAIPAVLVVGILLWGAVPTPAAAAVPSDQLLPSTTKGYLSVPNMDTLEREFDKTQWGQLMADPVMKPFADDLKRQLQQKWTRNHDKLGLTWDDVRGVPSGEVGIGKLLISPTKAVTVVVADVTGKLPAARELLAKIDRNMTEKKATKSSRREGDVTLAIYTHPKKSDQETADVAVAFLHEKEQQLVVCDDLNIALGVLKRFAGMQNDSLGRVEAYHAAMTRCREAAGELKPHLRWFLEPFGYTEAQRISNPQRRRKGQDMLKILKEQGFTCIQGVGGFVNFQVGSFDILHRTYAYVPPVKRPPGDKNKDKYDLAARMLNFPNGGDHQPATWIPRDLATFVSFNSDLRSGFEYSKTLVDAMADDPIFEDVLRSLEIDPNGPQVNIRKELVANLGERVMVFSDYALPITPKSERLLVAIEVTKSAPVAEAVRKLMENDPNHRKHTIAGVTVYEVVEDQAEMPKIDLDIDFGAEQKKPQAPARNARDEKKMMPSKAMAVAHGYLLVGSHLEILRRTLEEAETRLTLAGSVDYELVREGMRQLGAKNNCCQTFSRTDEEYRPTYELIRTGQMPQSETLVGKLLNNLFSEGDEDDEQRPLREQQIDGRKLPEFEHARRYFGPAGIFVNSEENGWIATGFFLSKQGPQLAERPQETAAANVLP